MSVYEFVELVGTSNESWEKAAATAMRIAASTLPETRDAEITRLDVQILGDSFSYRAKLKVSFKVNGKP
ncbi:MAG: dodecin domain-containing protein [Dehalococcoidia bacterium]|nr:dodecin domain-containing protein [Dehalococcoidia bacterium]